MRTKLLLSFEMNPCCVSRILICIWGNIPYHMCLWLCDPQDLQLFLWFSLMDRVSPKHSYVIQKQSTQWHNWNSKGKSCINPAHLSGGQRITKSRLKTLFGCFFSWFFVCLFVFCLGGGCLVGVFLLFYFFSIGIYERDYITPGKRLNFNATEDR